MASKSGPDIIEDGLVLCLDAASKRSYLGTGTTWTDLKGVNNGTLTNGPTFSNDNGGSVVFDGSNDRVDLSLPYNFTAFSVFFFVKYRSPQGNWRMVFDTYKNGDQHKFSFQSSTNSSNNVYLFHQDGNTVVDNTISIDQWMYYGATWDGSTVTTYKNGTSVTTDSSSTGFNLSNTIGIGDRYGGGSYSNNIVLSSITAYNRALTADEIRRNYLSTKERFA
jgi:hypothetical protein